MKLTTTLLLITAALSLGACSTTAPKEANLTPCCATGEPAKAVVVKDSWSEGGRVVRLAH